MRVEIRDSERHEKKVSMGSARVELPAEKLVPMQLSALPASPPPVDATVDFQRK